MPEENPTQGFEFPEDSRDSIERGLRSMVNPKEPVRSVRPERQKNPASPLVTPTMEAYKPPSTPKVSVQNRPSAHVSDKDGISVDLPSRFHYYPFKDLYIKPLRLPHLAKIAKAHDTGSMQTMAEVVSSVLYTPCGEENIGFKLSVADFNAVLYWLRLNSFSKKQMRLKWTCHNKLHLDAVERGEKSPESLEVSSLYTSSDLKFTYLESAPDPEHFSFELENYGKITMRPETISDVIDFMDHPLWEDAEFQYSARVASVLHVTKEDGSQMRLAEKVKMLEDASPDNALLALQFADAVDTFGVNEKVTTNCIGCGASSAVTIAVDALSFLSAEF